jgi:alkanesulfonate monooxygenase SsuD/methylene tetrahydromethanopterin reductase-like flavin-dependent oxidoreductase (luciferase family)
MVDIKFGVQLGGTWPLGVPSGKELLDLARHVDGLGYDSVHSNDNLVSPHGGPAPVLGCMQVLSAIAAVTQQVKIGPYALQLPMYNPAVAAPMMLTLDHLSGGRSLLAVSQGGAHEYEWGIWV